MALSTGYGWKYFFYQLSPVKPRIISKKLFLNNFYRKILFKQLQLILSLLIVIHATLDSPVLEYLCAISYAKHSVHLKCYVCNQLIHKVNLVRLLIMFHKLNLNGSIINSLWITITSMTYFKVTSFYLNLLTILQKLLRDYFPRFWSCYAEINLWFSSPFFF